MKKIVFALLLIVTAGFHLQAQKKYTHKHTAKKVSVTKNKDVIYGIASYYARKFNGRRTANDEIFSSVKYTAACNRLPFNTWIKVTNLSNNKTVIVRVNDRLYIKNTRLVDLSKIAAQKLGYLGKGTTKVKIEVLRHYRV